jgi:PKD repeat protein
MTPVNITATPTPATLAVAFAAVVGDPDANVPDSYAWSFGDGTTSTSATPTCTYAVGGSYVVRCAVTITDDDLVVGVHKASRRIEVGVSNVDTRLGIPLEGVSAEFLSRTPGGTTVTPAPVISSLSPNSGTAGAADAVCTITGTGFTPSSVARWVGVARTTTYISKTSISFVAPIAAASAGAKAVTVRNADGRVSAGSNFTLS